MGKLFFCFLFVAAASSTQAQSVGRPITVVSPHIQAPIAVHVPRVNPPQVRSFANTQQFRSPFNPLGNNPLVSPPIEPPNPAPLPRVQAQVVPSTRRVPLATTVETQDRTAGNGSTVGPV